MLDKEEKKEEVMESFRPLTGSWASDCINVLLSTKSNAPDIPAGYKLTGVALKEGLRKGEIDILFNFKEDK